MTAILYLIPISIILALVALGAFIWTVRTDQYDDMEGDAARILHSDDTPLSDD